MAMKAISNKPSTTLSSSSHELGRLFNLQPAGKGIAKLIAQIGDFIGRHWIGMGLQQKVRSFSHWTLSYLLRLLADPLWISHAVK